MTRSLIFDADDTLWENMIYFQHAIEEFLILVNPFASDPLRVRQLISSIERELIPSGGYGTRNFVNALKEASRRMYRGRDLAQVLRRTEEIGVKLINHPLDLRPGVADALKELHEQFRLLVFSKGDREEQQGKVRRSGLQGYFDQVIIADEKNPAAYQAILEQHGLVVDETFMIGNSPRSDILPALEVGMWAVYLPHPHTWEFEHYDLVPHSRLLLAESIQDLPHMLLTKLT
jgi:putative hydrolase of the HAD superfamily